MNFEQFVVKVKMRDSRFYDTLYRVAKKVRSIDVPYVRGWHDFLRHEQSLRHNAWRSFWRVSYHQPIFRSRCQSCGKRLHIFNSGQGSPFVQGDLKIIVGDDVKIYDQITLAGLTVAEKPTLVIGDNTEISHPISIFVGNRVEIGSNCIIGSRLIADNPGHNLDYRNRLGKLSKDQIGRVKIGDYAFAGMQSLIIGNVTVGFGSVIGACAVVTRDVPPFCVVAGNPGRIVKKLDFPKDLIEKLGRDEYEKYLAATIGSQSDS